MDAGHGVQDNRRMSMSEINHRFLRVLATLAVCATTTAASAEQPLVAAPPGAKLLLEAAAQGVQIYTCETGGDGYHWVFSAPDAALFDTAGRQIGTHFAGPTWHAITWLLLRVKSHAGNGVLSNVGLVRRIDTHAGTAPATACDATHAAVQARMRYTARYLFYAAP
jgi:hypothetical protein